MMTERQEAAVTETSHHPPSAATSGTAAHMEMYAWQTNVLIDT